MLIIFKHDLKNTDLLRGLILFEAFYDDISEKVNYRLTLNKWSRHAVQCAIISPTIENSELHCVLMLQGIIKTIAHSDCSPGVLDTCNIYCSDMEDPL